MVRYETVLEDGTVYVATDEDRLEIGAIEDVVAVVGGPSWTIRYSDREKQAHPELDTSDEGLTVDVVDTINAMTFGEEFVETLAAQPAEPVEGDLDGGDDGDSGDEGSDGNDGDDESDGIGDAPGPTGDRRPGDADTVSPRLGLFAGRLLENLEYGLR